ncbi:hypothetical protein O0L34_g469 [Tuta absoluta]|nr:hypothetical protein O0L34_g469 [Tuta absoluta]
MNTKKYHLENYRKYLLNRVTATPHLIEYMENCLASEDEAVYHSFHKIMIHNWPGTEASLFDALIDHFGSSFVPVHCTSQGAITTFYTSSLSLVLKITKLDFMFPHQRNMFNIDVLFNDKTSADCFENRVTIDDVVASVVSNRFSEKMELDLSNFCNDPEFEQKKICFYKINLLSNFKILMLRLGRDTKSLNLSNNNLSAVPVDILNFFIKGDLIAINFSNNLIPSLQELHRVSSKIEKLWVEGNPLCEELDPVTYVKQILMKFPRLNELDGVRLNDHGVPIPFFKNFLTTPDRRTKMIIDKFLSLYFAFYDHDRNNLQKFYAEDAVLTIASDLPAEISGGRYGNHFQNIISPQKRFNSVKNKQIHQYPAPIVGAFSFLPSTLHDPTTFTVDVLVHTKRHLLFVLEGVFKEMTTNGNYFHFRRTFVFHIKSKTPNAPNAPNEYYIINEMFYIALATKEQIERSFQDNTRGTNPMALYDPDPEDINSICYVFSHISQLRKSEAEQRLKSVNYDIRQAVQNFEADVKLNKISPDRFTEDDDFSDLSSLIDDEIDKAIENSV